MGAGPREGADGSGRRSPSPPPQAALHFNKIDPTHGEVPARLIREAAARLESQLELGHVSGSPRLRHDARTQRPVPITATKAPVSKRCWRAQVAAMRRSAAEIAAAYDGPGGKANLRDSMTYKRAADAASAVKQEVRIGRDVGMSILSTLFLWVGVSGVMLTVCREATFCLSRAVFGRVLTACYARM